MVLEHSAGGIRYGVMEWKTFRRRPDTEWRAQDSSVGEKGQYVAPGRGVLSPEGDNVNAVWTQTFLLISRFLPILSQILSLPCVQETPKLQTKRERQSIEGELEMERREQLRDGFLGKMERWVLPKTIYRLHLFFVLLLFLRSRCMIWTRGTEYSTHCLNPWQGNGAREDINLVNYDWSIQLAGVAKVQNSALLRISKFIYIFRSEVTKWLAVP